MIKEKRIMLEMELKSLLSREGLYTSGSQKDLDNLINYIKGRDMTCECILNVASNIKAHSINPITLTYLSHILVEKCCYSRFKEY